MMGSAAAYTQQQDEGPDSAAFHVRPDTQSLLYRPGLPMSDVHLMTSDADRFSMTSDADRFSNPV